MGFLNGVRVLDLTDERGLLAGRLLADLGADVVLVEPPAGSTARTHPPLPEGGEPGSSYYFDAFAANRRGIALDLNHPAGRAAAQSLAAAADILLTSYPAATRTGWGLDYEQLEPACPQLVYVAVTGFGTTGPKAGYAESDLVIWAAGGPLDPHRDEDRPPVRISVPQSYLHASADAAAGALLAHRAVASTGAGQYVDVSAQASLGVATLGRVLAAPAGDAQPEWHRESTPRTDQSGSGSGGAAALKKWRCRDGLIELHLAMGPAAGAFTNNFFAWLAEAGACDARTAGWDWRTVPEQLLAGSFTQADLHAARSATAAFLATKTKAEVLAEAVSRRLLCVGVYDARDLAADPHAHARGFFARVGSGEQARTLPARWVHDDAGSVGLRRPAPRLGQHTAEVFTDWLGADPEVAP